MNTFTENRQKLLKLIYSLKKFTEQELKEEFRRLYGDVAIGGSLTIHEYLRDLVHLAVLNEEWEEYTINRSSPL